MSLFSKVHRSSIWILIVVLALVTSGLAATSDGGATPLPPLRNQMAGHPSPYLALHGADPVAWQEWGPEVLARARRENKLIYISSGYFSCHWCHVMQRESYRDQQVAEVLNTFFIPVKVDRELEPALDKRLMNYAQATIQRGGWPLNVFVSPDGLPVFAMLYAPKSQFLALLNRLTVVWQQQAGRIRELALKEKQPVSFADSEPTLSSSLTNSLTAFAIQQIMASADELQGGFGQSNKFPSAPQLDFLLDSLQVRGNPEVVDFLNLTLAAMADNGMRDHLDGGFFRYVTDPAWEIPHFEKMLYDNANLARTYLTAGQVLDNDRYTRVAYDTLDFMMREMRSSEHALYASFSAVDDQDTEGGYYLWTNEQIKAALNEDEFRVFSLVWQTGRTRDFEAGNHLRAARDSQEVADELEMSEQQALGLLNSARQKLLAARAQRVLPTDHKLIAGWNGLALSAFSLAGSQSGNRRYQEQAREIRNFLLNKLWDGKHLVRSLAAGRLVGSASIEDYAYVAQGLYDWAQLDGMEQDYRQAEAVLKQGWDRFYQNNAWSFADTSLLPPADGEEILPDDASASPSAVLIATTIKLHNRGKLSDPTLYPRALSALNRGEQTLRGVPFWYASQIGAMGLAGQQ